MKRGIGTRSPLIRIYCFSIFPGIAKGWNLHLEHEDRYTIITGEFHVAMYDGREDSPTFGQCFDILISDRRRQSITVPIGVWHCDYNIGTSEAIVMNAPTSAYNYESPDKFRLPIYTDKIPCKIPEGLKGY